MRLILTVIILALGVRAAVVTVAAVAPLAYSSERLDRAIKGAQ